MSPNHEKFPRDKSCFVLPCRRCTLLLKPFVSHILFRSSHFLSQIYLQLVALVVRVDGKGLPPKEVRPNGGKRGNTVLFGFLFCVKSVVWRGMGKVTRTVYGALL